MFALFICFLFSTALAQEPVIEDVTAEDLEGDAPAQDIVAEEGAALVADLAPAPTATPEPPSAVEIGVLEATTIQIIDAAKSGNWGLVIAASLMLLTSVLRYFWSSLDKKYLPYVTVFVGAAGGFSTAIYAGQSVIASIFVGLGGAFSGLAAVGAWETVKPIARRGQAKKPGK